MTEVRGLIFDRSGTKQLAEIQPTIETVVWRLNNVGLSRISLPYTDSACTPDNLKPGNRLLLQFDDGLPDWGGVLDLPRRRLPTGVTMTGYTGEWLLDWRRTAKGRYFDEAQPGYIYQTLIEEANAVWQSGVLIGNVWLGGIPRTLEYHYHDLLRRVQDLARLTGHDFAVLPELSGGALRFYAHWYERRGADKSDGVWLIEDRNIGPPTLDEQGQLNNIVHLVGEGSTWGTERLVGESADYESVSEYGYREYAETQSSSVQATLDANADELVNFMAWPRSRITIGDAYDLDPARYADYGVGDIVTAQAFLASSPWTYEAEVRVIAREWQPGRGTCRLEVEEWRG